jgi:hypothetical protein
MGLGCNTLTLEQRASFSLEKVPTHFDAEDFDAKIAAFLEYRSQWRTLFGTAEVTTEYFAARNGLPDSPATFSEEAWAGATEAASAAELRSGRREAYGVRGGKHASRRRGEIGGRVEFGLAGVLVSRPTALDPPESIADREMPIPRSTPGPPCVISGLAARGAA